MFQLGMIPDKLKKMRKVIKILLLLILVFFSANYVLAQENDTIWTTKYDTITKKIIERNGGTISVESTYDVGTCFFVTLPASPDEQM